MTELGTLTIELCENVQPETIADSRLCKNDNLDNALTESGNLMIKSQIDRVEIKNEYVNRNPSNQGEMIQETLKTSRNDPISKNLPSKQELNKEKLFPNCKNTLDIDIINTR